VIYLDHNASSPLSPEARAAWLEAGERYPGNPSSPHRSGTRAEAALEQARQRLAGLLGCAPLDLVWTSGATEGCNTVLAHAAAAEPGAPVWVSAVEHPAVRESARHYFGARVAEIPVDGRGVVDLRWLEERRRVERPVLVAIMAANNETGVLQPWGEAQAWCAAAGVPLLCDATQWCGRLPAQGLGLCAYVVGSAHKFGGPRGVGFLKVPKAAALRPLLRGGKQLEGRRAGTENVAGVLAMLAALEWSEAQIAGGGAELRRARRDNFVAALAAAPPTARLNGAGADRLWNTVSVVLPEVDCRLRWVVKLDKAGFAVSTGSACASGSEQPSHVLTAMGLTPAEAGRAVRVSAGWMTTEKEWSDLLAAMERIQAEFSAVAPRADRERP
jgi:cysteine desulfurase